MKKDTDTEIPAITGSRIKCVRRMTKKEAKATGFTAIALILDTGVRLFAEDVAGEFEDEAFWVAPEKK